MTARSNKPAQQIRLLLLDVDGVLTDGGLYYFGGGGGGGEEGFALRFHVRDGLGIRKAQQAGMEVGIISGRSSPQVRRRAEELGISEIHLDVRDKRKVVEQILRRHGLESGQACFVGDDVVDLPAMEAVGFSVAVADAVEEVREAADWVTQRAGGQGAVREVIDKLL